MENAEYNADSMRYSERIYIIKLSTVNQKITSQDLIGAANFQYIFEYSHEQLGSAFKKEKILTKTKLKKGIDSWDIFKLDFPGKFLFFNFQSLLI